MSRQFSEKDAAEILKAAAKLQQESALGTNPSGVSVEDLKKIAEESGINPNFVDEALLTQAAKNTNRTDKGKLEATIDGELTLEQLGIVQESLSSLNGHKMLTQVGRTIQGTVSAPWCQLRVEVFSRNGRTKVQITPIYSMTFMMTGYAPALLAFLGLALGSMRGGLLMGVGFIALFGTISWLATMFGIGKANETAKKVFEQLCADISSELNSGRTIETDPRKSLAKAESAVDDGNESVENRQS